ncbi:MULTISPECIES: hypothetical protein [unclassified Polaromonas]|uniref:hypothetical protein n=1 Tax=unclassified Polaromonas TaxID=2638319 RepID=UPI0018C8F993|nr:MULTISPECIES: hypothetical protein [unclassified Polaromonas]MBG6074034.1 hypothetical protein [Polaromonas sp. CG_9.7]MBG6116045.1 hypothetical protein [Polaromonas sp. CG_9.2]MDH6182621.1 hypothetical protein [Polaromonas sp. CG_23.6]
MNSLFSNPWAKSGTALALAMAGILCGGAAHAAGTVSGTDIGNLATLNYTVGSTAQPPIGSSAGGNTVGAGTPTSFTVDNKVNLSLIESGSLVASVVPGATNQVTAFALTNLGNTAQGYTLAGANTSGANIAGSADNIDVSNIRVFVESGTTPGYQPLEDTATAILTLAPDTTRTVYIVADIPATVTNGQQANVSLTATTTTTGTATTVVQTTGANTVGVDIVFADAATTELEFVGASPARDAKATARNAYRVVTAALTVAKTATPLCDPLNGSANQKNIPGTLVRYTITITNSGASSATLNTITDTLVSSVTFDPNLVQGTGTAAPAITCSSTTGTPTSAAGSGFQITKTGGTRTGFPKNFTSTSSADGVDLAANVITATLGTVLPVDIGYAAGELKTGESISLIFNVQIN